MRRVLLPVLGVVLIAFSLPLPASHAADAAQRPRILGVAHMALYVTDIGLSRRFYEGLLGYAESHTLKRPDGSDRIVFIKINDDQFIELVTELPKDAQNEGHLHHIGFYTDSAEGVRRYLASRQVAVPETVAKTQNGNLILNFKDPDGHGIEIVQYEPNSRTRQNKGKYLPDTRISTHIYHVGVTIGPLERAMDFYHGILGFNEFWRGSSSGKVLSWVNMRVPDGDDYLEFMLGSGPSDAKQLGVKNHICLVVPNLDDAVAKLQTRVAAANYTQPIQIRTGVNGKRQANLFDPDGTRVELMEPQPASGKPVPSSTAPPPQ
ncbi:MAG: VOC family protein [Acidobacteria bacterium]|nr:VOC family protein [Acidobacteriota bacterium]